MKKEVEGQSFISPMHRYTALLIIIAAGLLSACREKYPPEIEAMRNSLEQQEEVQKQEMEVNNQIIDIAFYEGFKNEREKQYEEVAKKYNSEKMECDSLKVNHPNEKQKISRTYRIAMQLYKKALDLMIEIYNLEKIIGAKEDILRKEEAEIAGRKNALNVASNGSNLPELLEEGLYR